MTSFTYMDSPLGSMLLTADDEALSGVYFVGQKYQALTRPDWKEDGRSAVLERARAALLAYFEGHCKQFDIPLSLRGTPFQSRVWQALCDIPFGTTVTYAELARRVGASAIVRAVGGAVGRNPVSIIVPCHRVIGSDGSLTGYAGGLDRKRALLTLEGAKAKPNTEARRTQRKSETEMDLRQTELLLKYHDSGA